ncbi:hypothetical protein F4809DRAFT_651643 [Biscogniauxia mediterranea]|nr:hypothetical protein F4809DRAFT_651643 [Biscogniauxia mediterranea]
MSFREAFDKPEQRKFLALLDNMTDAIKVSEQAWKDYYAGVRPLDITVEIIRGLIQAVGVLEEEFDPDIKLVHDRLAEDPDEARVAAVPALVPVTITGPSHVLFAELMEVIDPIRCPDTVLSMATGEYDKAVVENYGLADEYFLVSFVMLMKWNLWNFKRGVLQEGGPGSRMQRHEEGEACFDDREQLSSLKKYEDDKAFFRMAWMAAFFPSPGSLFSRADGTALGEDLKKVQNIVTDGLRMQVINRFRAIPLTLVFRVQLFLVFHRIRRSDFGPSV